MEKWIEISNEQDCTYQLVCPVCGYKYSPEAAPDGTINSSEIHKFCQKCGEKLDDPAKDTRW